MLFRRFPLVVFFLGSILIAFPGSGSAEKLSESIEGKIGVTGRFGILLPADVWAPSDEPNEDQKNGPRGGIALLWGMTKTTAVEAEISYAELPVNAKERTFADGKWSEIGIKGEREMTNFALDIQVRPRNRLNRHGSMLYVGFGADLIHNRFKTSDSGRDVDVKRKWLPGGHFKFGLDQFVGRRAALNIEVKWTGAPNFHVRDAESGETFSIQSSSIAAGIGARVFF